MEKVKLNSKQATALEYVLSKYTGKEIILTHASNPNGWLERASGINSLDFDTLVKAIYYGYEIEQTPEEKLEELYDKYENYFLMSTSQTQRSYYQGICHGIKIARENLLK